MHALAVDFDIQLGFELNFCALGDVRRNGQFDLIRRIGCLWFSCASLSDGPLSVLPVVSLRFSMSI